MTTLSLRKQASRLAFAIALATGTAMVAGHVLPDPAFAQKRDRKKKDKGDEGSQAQFSKEFIAAYTPIDTQLKADPASAASLVPQVKALLASAQSPDERLQAGILAFNTGNNAKDDALRLQGIETMIASGKSPPDQLPAYQFTAYQLAEVLKDYPKARSYLMAAIDGGYQTEQNTPSDLRIALAQNHIRADEHKQGLAILKQAIAEKKAAGQPVDAQLYQYGFSVAFNNEVMPELYEYSRMFVRDYPTKENWLNAINVVRRFENFEDRQAVLDALRLSRRVDALTSKQEYIAYVEFADARRFPAEVKAVIEEGYANGLITRDDTFIAEELRKAETRLKADQAELPAVERDAMAAGASLRTVKAAADALLSYGQSAKAAVLYEKALGMPGVETDEVLTRLGIAQVGTGDYAAAQATLAKVSGERAPVAQLWSLYASMQSG